MKQKLSLAQLVFPMFWGDQQTMCMNEVHGTSLKLRDSELLISERGGVRRICVRIGHAALRFGVMMGVTSIALLKKVRSFYPRCLSA